MITRDPQRWSWWLAAPTLVLVLMFWCQLHGLALGTHAVSFDLSFPWAVRISLGWIIAGWLLLQIGAPVLDAGFARRGPRSARALVVVGILAVTLTLERALLADDKLLSQWLYERGPVHATFAMLMLGAWLLSRPKHAPELAPALPAQPAATPVMLDVLTGTGRTQVRLDDVECLVADRNYINVHTGQRSYLLRQTLTSFEKSLGSADFQRIHRSTIVNRAKIRERRRGGVLVLSSGRTVRISRAFASRLH